MMSVLLVIHLMVAAALVGVILIQKSEGGALGIGGGGGFMSGRGQANFLTRVTASLALAFFVTSIALTLVGKHVAPKGSVLDTAAPASSTTAPAAGDASAPSAPATGSEPAAPADAPRGGILDKLK